MVLFVGNPTNVVICEGFSLNNVGFTAYTILPFLACSLTCFITLAIQFYRAVPQKLDVSGNLNVRSVLLDPVGACVGSAMLGACLIVIIVVSFFNVEVWMISLPFAVSKFIWDLCWDTCRYIRKPVAGDGETETSDMNDEDNNVMLRQLKRQKTHGAIDMDLKPEPEKEGAGGIPNEAANKHENAVPTTPVLSQPSRAVTFDDHPLQRTHSPLSIDPTQTTRPSRSSTLKPPISPLSTLFSSKQDASSPSKSKSFSSLSSIGNALSNIQHRFSKYLSVHFPTFHTALPRLPFALVPFAFSQFILIEALNHQGWIDIFARWLVIVTKREMFKTIWVVGVLGVLLCNASGTNIGATILLTKIVRAAALSYVPPSSGPGVNIQAFLRSAAIALAIASNIGAVSFTFSASLAGLLWRQILTQKKIYVQQKTFARWNLAPIVVMTAVGLAVVSAEMAVLY